MRTKRFLVCTVAALLILSLVGCTPIKSKGDSNSAKTHKAVTLNYYIDGYANQKDANEVHDKVNSMIQKIYPWITVNFHISNDADYATHVALAQSSREQIDIIQTFNLDYAAESSDGEFYDITSLINEFPDLKAAIPSFAWGYGYFNKKLYGVPNYQQLNAFNYSLAVETNTAKKYGLDGNALNSAIQSSEFLSNKIYPIIEKMFQNSRAAGDKSLVFSPGKELGPQLRGYEVLTGPIVFAMKDNTCKLLNIWETDAVKDSLEWIYKFKSEGYIPQDYYTNRIASFGENAAKNGYVTFMYNDNAYVPNFPELRKLSWGLDLDFYCTRASKDNYYIGYTNAAGMTCVGENSASPEDALRVIELLNTAKGADIYNTLVYGIEGKHYTKNADGSIKTLEYSGGQATAASSYGMYKWNVGNVKNAWLDQSVTKDFNNWVFNDMNLKATRSKLIGFYPDTKNISSKMSQINAVVSQYQKTLIMCGTSDWKSTYNEFMTKLKAAGIDDVKKELQSQINTFLNSK